MYEFAQEDSQQYKEGKFILERSLVREYDEAFGDMFQI